MSTLSSRLKDSTLTIYFPSILLGAVSAHAGGLSPLMVGGMTEWFALSASLSSKIFSMEMSGMAIGVIYLLRFSRNLRVNQGVLLAIILMVTGNLLSVLADSAATLIPSRFCAGLGEGMGFGLMAYILGRSDQPDRLFALFFLINAFLVMIIAKLWPFMIAINGLDAIYYWLAVLAGLVLPSVMHFKRFGSETNESSEAVANSGARLPIILGAVGFLIFAAVVSGFWAFVERHGTSQGLSLVTISTALSVASFLGLFGALAATVCADRFARIRLLVVGYLGICMAAVICAYSDSPLIFSLSIAVYMLFWVFNNPFILGLVSSADDTGQGAMIATIALYVGLSAGPALSGMLWDWKGFYAITLVTLLGCMVSIFLLFLTQRGSAVTLRN